VDGDIGISTESGYEIDGETHLCCMPGHVEAQHVGEQCCCEVDGHAAKEEAIPGTSALLSSEIYAKELIRKVSTLRSLLLHQ
jgi:hypothetical protein